MKKISLLLMFLAVFSCSRDNTSIEDHNSVIERKELYGTWEWQKSSGGISPNTYTPSSTGTTKQIYITKDSIKIFENHILKSKYSYQILLKKSIYGGNREMIIYKPETLSQSFEFSGSQLILLDECYDCYYSEYAPSSWTCGTP